MKKLIPALFLISWCSSVLWANFPTQESVGLEAEKLLDEAKRENVEILKKISEEQSLLRENFSVNQKQIDELKSKLQELKANNSSLKKELEGVENSIGLYRDEKRRFRLSLSRATVELKNILRQSLTFFESPQVLSDYENQEKLDSEIPLQIKELFEVGLLELKESSRLSKYASLVADHEGKIIEADVFRLGNIQSYYHSPHDTGLLRPLAGSLKLHTTSIGKNGEGTRDVFEKEGTIGLIIDPTRGKAFRSEAATRSLFESIQAGGFFVWPILILGLVAGLIALERGFTLYRPKNYPGDLRLEKNIQARQWSELKEYLKEKETILSRVFKPNLKFSESGRKRLEQLFEESIQSEVIGLEKYLSYLGVIAAVSPLIGLLGTVTGMMSTFDVITMFGTSNPRLMSGGISEALVTTQLGLVVAVPTLMLYHILSIRASRLVELLEKVATKFIDEVSPSVKDSEV